MGSRSFHRRIIVFLICLSTILTFFKLKNGHIPDSSWLNIIEEALKKKPEKSTEILGVAVFSSCVFVIIALYSKFPLPLDSSFCAFFYGYLFYSTLNSEWTLTVTRSLILPYLVLPIISGCFTWCLYRVLILGIMYADREDKFKITLSWCGFIYPLTVATSISVFCLKYFFASYSHFYNLIFGVLTFLCGFGITYAFFGGFLRAWLKRRVFLMYPQEYAVYLERSEKVEQGDREARGLGPIQDYYLPKTSGSSSTGGNNMYPITKDNNSMNPPATVVTTLSPQISPAVIAGKLAITSKRSEELFTPALNFISIVTLFTLTSLESRNLLIILNRALPVDPPQAAPSPFLLWSCLFVILTGGLFLSQRSALFLGRSIIDDMKFSQAFAIQMGILLTINLGMFLNSIPLAPMWYLLFSIAAVCSSQEQDENIINAQTFRYKFGLIVLFWICSVAFSFSAGYILYLSHHQ